MQEENLRNHHVRKFHLVLKADQDAVGGRPDVHIFESSRLYANIREMSCQYP